MSIKNLINYQNLGTIIINKTIKTFLYIYALLVLEIMHIHPFPKKISKQVN